MYLQPKDREWIGVSGGFSYGIGEFFPPLRPFLVVKYPETLFAYLFYSFFCGKIGDYVPFFHISLVYPIIN